MNVRRLAKKHNLGNLIHKYPLRLKTLFSLLSLILISFPVGCLMMGLSYVLASQSNQIWIALSVFGAIAILVSLYMSAKFILLVRGGGLYCYEFGLIDTQGIRRRVVKYDAISSLWVKIINQNDEIDKYIGSSYSYTIRTKKGKRLTFDETFRKVDEIGQYLIEQVLKHQYPKAVKNYQSGESLRFGKINLQKNYIGYGKKQIPWSKVKSIRISDGKLHIKQKGKGLLKTFPIYRIPNFPILLYLLRQQCNII